MLHGKEISASRIPLYIVLRHLLEKGQGKCKNQGCLRLCDKLWLAWVVGRHLQKMQHASVIQSFMKKLLQYIKLLTKLKVQGCRMPWELT